MNLTHFLLFQISHYLQKIMPYSDQPISFKKITYQCTTVDASDQSFEGILRLYFGQLGIFGDNQNQMKFFKIKNPPLSIENCCCEFMLFVLNFINSCFILAPTAFLYNQSIMQQQSTNGVTLANRPSPSKGKVKGGTDPKAKKKKAFSPIIINLISNQRWNLSCKKWSHQEISYILESTKDYHNIVQMLWLHWNAFPTIFSTLNNYNFAILKIINVGGNNIESVENLQFGCYQSVQELWLWNNKIVKIDCLRKCYFPKLKYIDISQNCILQCAKLYELKAQALERINIENNRFTTLNHFVKPFRASTNSFKILFMQNQLIKAFDTPLRRGKYLINQITFNRQQKNLLKYN